MYKEYFSLKEFPFSIAPDPRYLYMSEHHREALAHLIYGINSDGGFVLLTGEVGTGKTTICRCLLEQIPDTTDVAFIINPKVTVVEILAAICDELGIQYPEGNSSIKVFVDCINAYLLDAYARGRKTVLIIEEAQNLSPDVLEQIRLLTNLETNQNKLLQIIMLGQPELREILSRPDMQQLSQRITARYHMSPLSDREVGAYISHRLTIAGADTALFPDSVFETVYHFSHGIPRLINVICDRALLGSYVQGKDHVDKATLTEAAHEVLGNGAAQRQWRKWLLPGLILLCTGIISFVILYKYGTQVNITKKSGPTFAAEKPAEPQRPDLFARTSGKAAEETRDMAYEALFRQWNISYKVQKNLNICRQVQTYGLRCLNGLGNFDELKILNRPAVLKLVNDNGRELYVTLLSIQDQDAVFQSGDDTIKYGIKEIEKQWLGEYTLFWKMPPHYQGPFRPGYKGDVVKWLNVRMSQIQGQKTQPKEKLEYDNELVRQVKKFQLAKGLTPDGVIGPHTIIHLSNAGGSVEPVLVKTAEVN